MVEGLGLTLVLAAAAVTPARGQATAAAQASNVAAAPLSSELKGECFRV